MRLLPLRAFLLPLLLLTLAACRDSSEEEQQGCETTGCASTERCNPGTHACEPLPACASASDCAKGEECLGGVCSSCQSNIQCAGALGTCDPLTLECVGCTADAQCGTATPHCSSGGACLECTTDAHCPGGKCFRGWCGQCRLNSDCPSGQTCEGGQCRTSCYSDAQCAAGAPLCVDGSCLGCRHDADCAAGQGCYEGSCRTPYPGDTCRSALPVALGGGSAVVEGSIPFGYEAKTDPYSSESFTDVYYAVDITQEGFLDLALTPRGLSPEVTVSVLTGDCGALHEMASAPRTLNGVFVVPGRYLVRIAESTYSFMSSFRLSVRFTPGSRSAGNHCLKPIALPVGQPGGSSTALTVSFAGLLPVSPDLCEDDKPSTARPDLVYGFTLSERSAVNVRATPENPADRLDLRLKRSCWEGDGSCSYDSAPGAVGLSRGPLEPGDYVVVLRSRAGSSPVALEVGVVPWATNSTCETALPVTFDATGKAVVQGNTDYADAGIGGCSGGWGSRVQHYRVSTVGLGRRSLVTQVLTRNGTGGVVALHPTCRTEQNVQAAYCAGTGMNRVNDLPEGTYDLTVTSAGAFTLTLTLGEPYPRPTNDTCSAPQALTLAGDGTFRVTGDTRGATAFINDRCGTESWGTTSRDVVFSVPGTGRGRLYATLRPTSEGYNPALMLSDFCSTGVRACSDQSGPGGDESTSMRFWARGSEVPLLWVTARDGSEGTFSLSGRFEPAPANDACAGAVPVSLDALGSGSVTGDIGLAFPDNDDRCTSSGPALYYQFTAVKNASYRVRLVPTGFDAQLTVFDTCGGGSCTAGPANAAGVGGAEELTVNTGTSGGIFRIGVHGALVDDAGAFTLGVTRL
jgi:hypothetical protein